MQIVWKSGNLRLLEPSGPVQACNGIAFISQGVAKNKIFKCAEFDFVFVVLRRDIDFEIEKLYFIVEHRFIYLFFCCGAATQRESWPPYS